MKKKNLQIDYSQSNEYNMNDMDKERSVANTTKNATLTTFNYTGSKFHTKAGIYLSTFNSPRTETLQINYQNNDNRANEGLITKKNTAVGNLNKLNSSINLNNLLLNNIATSSTPTGNTTKRYKNEKEILVKKGKPTVNYFRDILNNNDNEGNNGNLFVDKLSNLNALSNLSNNKNYIFSKGEKSTLSGIKVETHLGTLKVTERGSNAVTDRIKTLNKNLNNNLNELSQKKAITVEKPTAEKNKSKTENIKFERTRKKFDSIEHNRSDIINISKEDSLRNNIDLLDIKRKNAKSVTVRNIDHAGLDKNYVKRTVQKCNIGLTKNEIEDTKLHQMDEYYSKLKNINGNYNTAMNFYSNKKKINDNFNGDKKQVKFFNLLEVRGSKERDLLKDHQVEVFRLFTKKLTSKINFDDFKRKDYHSDVMKARETIRIKKHVSSLKLDKDITQSEDENNAKTSRTKFSEKRITIIKSEKINSIPNKPLKIHSEELSEDLTIDRTDETNTTKNTRRLPIDVNFFVQKVKHTDFESKKIETENVKKSEIYNEFNRDLIEKIKLLEKFIGKYNKEKFKSTKNKYKKIYVIRDGTIVINENYVDGKFIDFPIKRLLLGLKTKKERMEKFFEFLELSSEMFKISKKFKNAFTMSGTPIFDLADIPEKDKIIFVCKNIKLIFSKFSYFQRNKNNTKKKFKKNGNRFRRVQNIKK